MRSTATSARIRVLVVDDHPIFGEGLAALCERTDDLEIVGSASTRNEAIAEARTLQPAIILLDISLGNGAINGLDLIHQLRCICPNVKIAVFTGHANPEYVMSALRLGVEAYLQKDIAPASLLNALRQVNEGERVIGSPQQLTLALTQLQEIAQSHARANSGLTEPELEMLRLAATGSNNKEIGAQQFWSEITVKRKMQSVYRKLGVSSRAQAVAEAIRRGFV